MTDSADKSVQILVSQKGAREHYAVAQALHQRGILAGLVTDWYAFGRSREQRSLGVEKKNFSYFLSATASRCFGRRRQAALAAHCDALPDELVHAFPLRSLLAKWRFRRMTRQGQLYKSYEYSDAAFGRAVARLKLPPHDVFFGYSYASLEMLESENARGVLTVLDQIDPGPVEFRLVAKEMDRFPELAGPPPEFPDAYYSRNRLEWEQADVIVVNSEWSRDALIAEGIATDKIEILPLAYEAEEKADRGWQLAVNRDCECLTRKSAHTSQTTDNGQQTTLQAPLRVLWLGQVNIRKGIHYLMEAARLLERENIHFEIVGPLGILPAAVASAPNNMTFHGPVSRDRAADWYRRSDVFVLPTLSDGFALTQLEALAHGLPVIATPNCGRVVEEGKTGFIVPARDSRSLVEAILKFVTDRHLASSMAPACRTAVKTFSLADFGARLVSIIEKHSKCRDLHSPTTSSCHDIRPTHCA